MAKYVIIGNGTAAVGAIEGIRSADKVGPITVISTEPYHVYGRPLISYMLLGKTTEEKMLRYRPDDFYEKNHVTTMLGKTVQHIDPKKQTVSLESGESVPYDRLCICTGSRPFVPPMEGLDKVENKTSFMTLDDAKHLNGMLGDKNDKRVLIVGAGLIGLKCAEGIYQRVSELTVIDLAPRILPNVLTEVPATIIQKHIESKGVKFLLGDSVAQFEPAKAHLKSGGEIDFDILVVAVGVRPNLPPRQAARSTAAFSSTSTPPPACRTSMPQATARSPTTSRPVWTASSPSCRTPICRARPQAKIWQTISARSPRPSR